MVPPGEVKTNRAGLALYANLLDPSSSSTSTPSTISRAPVVFKALPDEDAHHTEDATKQQLNTASLRFQPTKRPQLPAQKPKPKSAAQKPANYTASSSPQIFTSTEAPPTTSRPAPKNTLADWTAKGVDDDVNGFYGAEEKRQRGGRKKRKKNKEESHAPQDWDDIYDPSRPNNYEEYKNSDEKIREVREWKDRLYAHRILRSSSVSESDTESRLRRGIQSQFAPPSMSFAPPLAFSDATPSERRPSLSTQDDPTGEDAYARRMRLSQGSQKQSWQHETSAQGQYEEPMPSHRLPLPEPPTYAPASTISRAPVRYNLPAAPPELPRSEVELESALLEEGKQEEEELEIDDTQRSLRPGQKGFAERLMSKYGWTKGSGLGASGSGIVNPLRVQVEKQKKKPDSEGGGFAGPGGRGKILGGRKKGESGESEGKFGAMSEVIILHGMVQGMDLDIELESAGDGGLMQEIGEECGEKYGRVERVFVDRSSHKDTPVFVKFTSQLSALRAVNALAGRIFNGNQIRARFFDADKFEAGLYT